MKKHPRLFNWRHLTKPARSTRPLSWGSCLWSTVYWPVAIDSACVFSMNSLQPISLQAYVFIYMCVCVCLFVLTFKNVCVRTRVFKNHIYVLIHINCIHTKSTYKLYCQSTASGRVGENVHRAVLTSAGAAPWPSLLCLNFHPVEPWETPQRSDSLRRQMMESGCEMKAFNGGLY